MIRLEVICRTKMNFKWKNISIPWTSCNNNDIYTIYSPPPIDFGSQLGIASFACIANCQILRGRVRQLGFSAMLHDYFYNFLRLMHFILRWVSQNCIAFCTHTPIGPYMTFICDIKTQFAHFSAKIKKNRGFSKLPPLNNNVRVFGIKKGILWTGSTPKQMPYTHFINWYK